MCPKHPHIQIQRTELQGSLLKGSRLYFATVKLRPERLRAWLKVIQLIGGKGGTGREITSLWATRFTSLLCINLNFRIVLLDTPS